MQLRIEPHSKNSHPIGGFLIKGVSPLHWAQELQRLGFKINQTDVFPIPGLVANSIWGCLVVPRQSSIYAYNPHESCQLLSNTLFIPEYSQVAPPLVQDDIATLFKGKRYILHPEFGIYELGETVDWKSCIAVPEASSMALKKPEPTPFYPTRVRSFKIHTPSPEEVLKHLEEQVFPKQEKLENKPLNTLEKIKLSVYKTLLKGKSGSDKMLPKFLRSNEKAQNLLKNALEDYENLEERNKNTVDKLVDMLKKNPLDALKYAIPLDEHGTTRGGQKQRLDLSRRWNGFSPLMSSQGGGSGAVDIGNHYYTLQKQYQDTAHELTAQGEYRQAAFVYMKLLKNYPMAAQTLENGKLYEEAASVYLNHCKNKDKAAENYEKGNCLERAIELNIELEKFEKAGDILLKTDQQGEALKYYQLAVDEHKKNSNYWLASELYRYKMNDEERAQESLLTGWNEDKQAERCLNSYLKRIDDNHKRWREIKNVSEHTKAIMQPKLLNVLKKEFGRNDDISYNIKNLAYEIISKGLESNRLSADELTAFNEGDKQLSNDIIRYQRKSK